MLQKRAYFRAQVKENEAQHYGTLRLHVRREHVFEVRAEGGSKLWLGWCMPVPAHGHATACWQKTGCKPPTITLTWPLPCFCITGLVLPAAPGWLA